MQLNGISLKKVKISKINPIYIEHISDSKQKQLLRNLRSNKPLNSYMVVEKDKVKETYWLVSGFAVYSAYKALEEQNTNGRTILATCIVRPYNNKTDKRITLLNTMFNHQVSYWMDKHNLIASLLEKDKSPIEIAGKIGVNVSLVESYLIHPDIPEDIIEMVKKNSGSIITLEKIRKINFSDYIKGKLYKRAGLRKRHPDRLTNEKLQKIKWLINREGFSELKVTQQWTLIQKAIHYKLTLENIWDLDIKHFSNMDKEEKENFELLATHHYHIKNIDNGINQSNYPI